MRNRSRLEIYLDLIEGVSDHGDPMTIGKEVNLSLSDAQEHLGFLISQGFLRIAEEANSEVKYELTPKGLEALEALRMLTEREHPLLKHTLSARVEK